MSDAIQPYVIAVGGLVILVAIAIVFFGGLCLWAYTPKARLAMKESRQIPLGFWSILTWVWIFDVYYDFIAPQATKAMSKTPEFCSLIYVIVSTLVWLIIGGYATGLFFALLMTHEQSVEQTPEV